METYYWIGILICVVLFFMFLTPEKFRQRKQRHQKEQKAKNILQKTFEYEKNLPLLREIYINKKFFLTYGLKLINEDQEVVSHFSLVISSSSVYPERIPIIFTDIKVVGLKTLEEVRYCFHYIIPSDNYEFKIKYLSDSTVILNSDVLGDMSIPTSLLGENYPKNQTVMVKFFLKETDDFDVIMPVFVK